MPRSESKHTAHDDDDYEAKGSGGAKSTCEDKELQGDSEAPSLIQKVMDYFFDDDAFAQTFERWAEQHCAVFDPDSEEMKLEYTELYNEFQAMFEEKLEDFIVSQGSSIEDFYQMVRRAYEKDRESSEVLCSEILIATADFDVFVLMMKQTKESMRLAKQ